MLLKEWGERVGLIEIASNNSVWRGMDYYENKKVLSWHKAEDGTYNGVVSGQEGKDYSVHIDKIHPRKSTCNCPFADDNAVHPLLHIHNNLVDSLYPVHHPIESDLLLLMQI